MIKIFLTTILAFSTCILTSGQIIPFKKVVVDKEFIDTGQFKNYYKYDFGDFILYNGRYENNLRLQILEKENLKIVLDRDHSSSDAMILKPIFFMIPDSTISIILVEVAAEYSWGQELILVRNNKVKYLGYFDYAVDIDNGLSVADYCSFSLVRNEIIMTFENVPIVYWPEESAKIYGKDLKFKLTEKIEKLK